MNFYSYIYFPLENSAKIVFVFQSNKFPKENNGFLTYINQFRLLRNYSANSFWWIASTSFGWYYPVNGAAGGEKVGAGFIPRSKFFTALPFYFLPFGLHSLSSYVVTACRHRFLSHPCCLCLLLSAKLTFFRAHTGDFQQQDVLRADFCEFQRFFIRC